jgi:hypothetical protein
MFLVHIKTLKFQDRNDGHKLRSTGVKNISQVT